MVNEFLVGESVRRRGVRVCVCAGDYDVLIAHYARYCFKHTVVFA